MPGFEKSPPWGGLFRAGKPTMMKSWFRLTGGFVLCGAAAFAATPDSARVSDSLAPGALPSYVIRIDSIAVDGANVTDTLDIVLAAYGSGLAGLSLKIATEYYGLDIIEILPGEFVSACRWSMFSARELPRTNLPARLSPTELWQITALAKTDPNGDTLACNQLDHPASFARVVVMTAGLTPGFKAPVFFYWESCRDNLISDPVGASVIVSESVTDRIPVELTTERAAFPTRYGTPEECVNPRARALPQRRVVFINGGITYGESTIDSTRQISSPDSARP